MIPIKRLSLDKKTDSTLQKRQTSASKLRPQSPKIKERWKYLFNSKNKENIQALSDILKSLNDMFQNKCCYCEKIISKDIEHFYPKTLYPNKMFEWKNMLKSCKDCNFEKLAADPDNPKDATGNRSLLDPTIDRPEDFLSWDLLTGAPVYPVVSPATSPPGIHRGQRTVQVCGLDHQSMRMERVKHAGMFLLLIDKVDQENPVKADTIQCLDRLIDPAAPWLAIIRQILRDPAKSPLIASVEKKLPHLAPRFDALRWTHP